MSMRTWTRRCWRVAMATWLGPNMSTSFSENSHRLASTFVMRCCREVGLKGSGEEGGGGRGEGWGGRRGEEEGGVTVRELWCGGDTVLGCKACTYASLSLLLHIPISHCSSPFTDLPSPYPLPPISLLHLHHPFLITSQHFSSPTHLQFLPSPTTSPFHVPLPIFSLRFPRTHNYIAGTDFSQTGSLVKDRHLLQRQLSSSGTSKKYSCLKCM